MKIAGDARAKRYVRAPPRRFFKRALAASLAGRKDYHGNVAIGSGLPAEAGLGVLLFNKPQLMSAKTFRDKNVSGDNYKKPGVRRKGLE